ncbi:DEAD/DEAH box helicase family protein [Colwellia sp. Arc7-D]|uniref:DEAD/DEAH box helicase n=1 Tax=Colwellia sp. Arc7-D TaxID=2161872 RepID=UPI000D3D920F|nr:DEAD/DEAH box helicase family protein [Colwellia sp. Arc7-D]AWB57859.1 DEAD/DEAH box helicase [Colwellia sp. Arc7-D]
MKLRLWQQECIETAFSKYLLGSKHFLALATPGAGKTHMSSSLADKLIEKDMIDLVVCLAPSTIVASDFKESLSLKLKSRFDGLLGSSGLVSTYQNLLHVDENFWELFKKFRVFVIFDEIHHCSGTKLENANAWGEKIIENIKDQATYTIALTGTPWRSDKTPIVLSNYCNLTNKIICDYSYGLKKSIEDGVCRVPEIIAIDNDSISVVDKSENLSFNSFLDLLSQEILPYHIIINDENVILQLITRANKRLQSIRNTNPDAGGLIIAYSIQHAKKIQRILHDKLNKAAVVVTYREDDPNQLIRNYRNNSDEWLISVGMVSEGTNIPRLQICCHLTNIKTEMHYRQILGRILRVTSSADQSAVLYMPAEPKLVEYAYRIGRDLPNGADIIKFEKISSHFKTKLKKCNQLIDREANEIEEIGNYPVNTKKPVLSFFKPEQSLFQENVVYAKNPLTEVYEKSVNIFGRFKQETLVIDIQGDLVNEKFLKSLSRVSCEN